MMLNEMDKHTVMAMVRALTRLQAKNAALIRTTGKAYPVALRTWSKKDTEYFGKKPVRVHPVFSLPNRKGLQVECIKLDEAKIVPEEKIKMILAVLAWLMDQQQKRNPAKTMDPYDDPEVDYKDAMRGHWHELIGPKDSRPRHGGRDAAHHHYHHPGGSWAAWRFQG